MAYILVDDNDAPVLLTHRPEPRKFRNPSAARAAQEATAELLSEPVMVVCDECGWDLDDCDDGTDDHREHHRVLREWINRK